MKKLEYKEVDSLIRFVQTLKTEGKKLNLSEVIKIKKVTENVAKIMRKVPVNKRYNVLRASAILHGFDFVINENGKQEVVNIRKFNPLTPK